MFSSTVEQKPGKQAETGVFAEVRCDLSCRDVTIWRLGLLLKVSPQVETHLWLGVWKISLCLDVDTFQANCCSFSVNWTYFSKPVYTEFLEAVCFVDLTNLQFISDSHTRVFLEVLETSRITPVM